MPKFSVDVKAFMTVSVEAPNKKAARAAAEEFVEACDPTDPVIHGYNSFRATRAIEPHTVLSAGGFAVDGTSDVEKLCEKCEEPLEPILASSEPELCSSCADDEICGQCHDPRCDGCVPFDTPSLDTSFHDHEMDV
jgi:hypothetical protein